MPAATPATPPHPARTQAAHGAGSSDAGRRPCTPFVERPRTDRPGPPRRPGDDSGSEVSLGDLPQHRLVQLGLGDELLQPGVLDLEVLEPLRVVRLHAAVLRDPAVPGRLGNLE